MESNQRRWLTRYALTLAALTALAVWAAVRLPTYRDPPLDFTTLTTEQYFSTAGLTRRQAGGVKLGFAESAASPAIGVFGNHIVSFFGEEAFAEPERAGGFFNYSYANLSLPETLRLLRHLEARDALPRELMIVAVTPPNADNGHFIIDHGQELPPDITLGDALRRPDDPAGLVDALWRTLEIRLHEPFNYNTLILGLAYRDGQTHLVTPETCEQPGAAWLEALPYSVRRVIRPYLYPDLCFKPWTLRRDGSSNTLEESSPRLNGDPLDEAERGLQAGDERAIAENLLAIDAVGRRNGLAVVFLITPVFETDRSDSIVNQVFDRALALAPGLAVIDDRGLRDDPSLIYDYLHPTPAYYRHVANQLRRRGYLESSPTPAPAEATVVGP